MDPAATETDVPGYIMGFSLAAMERTRHIRRVVYALKKRIFKDRDIMNYKIK